MAKKSGIGAFIGNIVNARIDGLKDAAVQGVEDVAKNVKTGFRTVDGVIGDGNTSYLQTGSDPGEPIYEVMAKDDGKNARITLWPDRLEWERGRGVSAGKIVVGVLTYGISLAFTGVRSDKDGFETLPLSAVQGVSIRKENGGQSVNVLTAGGEIGFVVSRYNAADFRLAIINQLQAIENAPQKVVIEGLSNSGHGVDFTQQLKNLAELRDSGVLTEEEFQLKKAEILKVN